MRKKQIFTLLIVFSFISVASFSVIFYAKGDVKSSKYTGFDIEKIDGCKHADALSLEGVEFTYPHSPWEYPLIDDHLGILYWLNFTNIYNGTHGNIWIGLTEYDEYIDNGPEGYSPEDIWVFSYPWTPTGIEGYLPPGYRDTITGQDLLDVLYQFDSNIHDTDVQHFGQYADRPGPYGDYKTQVMIFNVRDEFFYSPDTAPGFIEGYFWSEIAAWGVNAFHMDSYQWWRRQGENPPMVDPLTGYDYSFLSVKAWEYEGTFAHEFQHLINNDVDFDELAWADEGMSTLAEWICGYGFSPGHISEYLIWFWDTPLTIWEGYLADYGASFLWTFYMYEHYGGAELIWDVCHEQANGIEGWSNALKNRHIKRSFDQIFEDWAIANYLDDTSFAHGRYGYYELDIPSENSEGLSIPEVMWIWANTPEWVNPVYEGLGWLFPWQVDEYPHDGVAYPLYNFRGMEYTVNYVEFYDAPLLLEVDFDGDDYGSAIYPYSGTYEWFSGGGSWSWFRLGQIFNIPETGATLKFQTYYEIEEDWDYGYVEVHDLTTDEWYTLPGVLTTDILVYAQDNPNTPDGLEPADYDDLNNWNALTGFSPGWYQEIMDLTPFHGHSIELYFTYWTDGAYNEIGWFIDDIEIPEIGFFDDVESGSDGWDVNAGWYITDGIVENDFEVNFIVSTTLTSRHGAPWKTWHYIDSMKLNDETEEGDELLIVINTRRIQTVVTMVVANQPGIQHNFGSGYSFYADRFHWCSHFR